MTSKACDIHTHDIFKIFIVSIAEISLFIFCSMGLSINFVGLK